MNILAAMRRARPRVWLLWVLATITLLGIVAVPGAPISAGIDANVSGVVMGCDPQDRSVSCNDAPLAACSFLPHLSACQETPPPPPTCGPGDDTVEACQETPPPPPTCGPGDDTVEACQETPPPPPTCGPGDDTVEACQETPPPPPTCGPGDDTVEACQETPPPPPTCGPGDDTVEACQETPPPPPTCGPGDDTVEACQETPPPPPTCGPGDDTVEACQETPPPPPTCGPGDDTVEACQETPPPPPTCGPGDDTVEACQETPPPPPTCGPGDDTVEACQETPPPPTPTPGPGEWSGSAVIEYTRASSDSESTDYGAGSYISNSSDESVTITTTYELTSVDPSIPPGELSLPAGCEYGPQPGDVSCGDVARVALTGVDTVVGEISNTFTVLTVSRGALQDMGHPDRMIGCDYDKSSIRTQDGSWAFEGDASGTLSVMADGTYQITLLGGAYGEVSVPMTTVDAFEPHRGIDCAPASSSSTTYSTDPSSSATQYLSPDGIRGRIDPIDPGNTLSGSMAQMGDDGSILTVDWNFVHDGPSSTP